MTADDFRRLALSLPEAVESAHMNHPDFRVGGKIFCTLGPDEDWAMVKLQPDQQAPLVAAMPEVFSPASGAWGRNGATIIQLAAADTEAVTTAVMSAWKNTAPARLLRDTDD